VFRQDTDESLDTAEDGSVNHNRSNEIVLSLLCWCSVLKLESFRQVEVELRQTVSIIPSICPESRTHLNGGTLEFSLKGIADGDIDLGTVELQRYQMCAKRKPKHHDSQHRQPR
jgi:hypothetical protein